MFSKEIQEIYEIRILLECAAVRSCALHANENTTIALRTLYGSLRDNLQRGDILQTLKLTTEFYRIIFATGGKTVSWDLVERLNGRISRLRTMTLATPGRKQKGLDNLENMLMAIKKAI